MVMPSKTIFLFILVCFINFITIQANNNNNNNFRWSSYSNIHETTPTSIFQINLKTLLSYLSSNATANKEFHNATVTDINNSSNTVYGLFMCKGDVPAHLCSQCVTNVTSYNDWESGCSLCKDMVIWYDMCMVRYSDKYFFSTLDLFSSSSSSCSAVDVSNQTISKRLVSETLNEVADKAANFSIGIKRYATKDVIVSGLQNLYFQAQCTPDLSPQDCRKCLNESITQVLRNCNRDSNYVMTGDSKTSGCYIRYDVYPFYRSINAPTILELDPASNTTNSNYIRK
ncbi:putative cysteine-rich receptor-like protein kinase 20 [Vicia villosa]|uniref:putative cysteine-rich receptor-like protein kinase 20 n=1 Tax=Vicia villosa TaxID=3911 RepID=UPI00273BDD31|nr:putative cysteine-rich receptor-like protein kinase 20 [Vicia villosa]